MLRDKFTDGMLLVELEIRATEDCLERLFSFDLDRGKPGTLTGFIMDPE